MLKCSCALTLLLLLLLYGSHIFKALLRKSVLKGKDKEHPVTGH
jgi:hypothetical protein